MKLNLQIEKNLAQNFTCKRKYNIFSSPFKCTITKYNVNWKFKEKNK